MKGGARSRSGPPPDPQALRRDRPSDAAGWVQLPAAGRSGAAPEWPLPRPTARERAIWDREWTRPQALLWEANGQAVEVALYVRTLVAAERTKTTVAHRTLVRQQMDALGLTEPGLQRNRWRIVDEVADERPQSTRVPDGASARDRLKLVVGGDA